jgi:uncharacterized protein YegL
MSGAMAFGKYAASASEDTHALVHIEAPKYVPEEEKERGTLDIVAVVDVSGSMGGSKLELAKTTLEFIVENLTDKDRLCIVAYDSSVTVPLNLAKMTESGKSTAMDKIKALRAGSCTNLSGGLFKGIDIVKSRSKKSKAAVTSILLMTDGEANEGIVGEDLIKATRKKIGENPDFSLYTFGYGASHNEYLLKNLSEVGSGMYYFIENNDIIPESFGDCLGGLLSVVAQNMKVSFTAKNGATIKKIHTKRRQTLADDGKSGTVSLNDIQSEEKRDIVLSLTLPATKQEEDNVEYVEVKLDYVNAITMAFASTSTTITASRPMEVRDEDREKNSEVEAQVNRIKAADAMATAMEAARKSDFVTARACLTAEIDQLMDYEDGLSSELRNDMQECMRGLSSRDSYEQQGRFHLASKQQAHSFQRCNFVSSAPMAEKSSYTTSSRGVFQAKALKKKMAKRG